MLTPLTPVPSFPARFGSVAVLQLRPSRQCRLLVWQRSRGARPGSIGTVKVVRYIWEAAQPGADPRPQTRGKVRGQLPSVPVDSDFVGEIGHLSRMAFFVCWVSPSGSDGRKKVGPKPAFFTLGLTPPQHRDRGYLRSVPYN